MLTSVVGGLNFGPERLAVIRRATAFNDQLAQAHIQMNQEEKSTNSSIHCYGNNPDASGRAIKHLPSHQEQLAQRH